MLIKQTFKIIDMDCISCSITIDGDLESRTGVKRAQTRYAKAETEVEYDSKKVNASQIITIIKKSGYNAVLITGK